MDVTLICFSVRTVNTATYTDVTVAADLRASHKQVVKPHAGGLRHDHVLIISDIEATTCFGVRTLDCSSPRSIDVSRRRREHKVPPSGRIRLPPSEKPSATRLSKWVFCFVAFGGPAARAT